MIIYTVHIDPDYYENMIIYTHKIRKDKIKFIAKINVSVYR